MVKKRRSPLTICAQTCCRSEALDNNINKIIGTKF